MSCWLVALLTRHSHRDALVIGALMNTRGLVELVVLSIGLQHHVITPALFSIMVLVAIITTMLAGPVIALIYPRSARWRSGGLDQADPAARGSEVHAHLSEAEGRIRAGLPPRYWRTIGSRGTCVTISGLPAVTIDVSPSDIVSPVSKSLRIMCVKNTMFSASTVGLPR